MRILSIETSCDETSAAVVEKIDETNVRVLSNVTATSLALHATTGGIIPENAAREQIKFIIPVIIRALCESRSMNHESWFDAQKIIADDIDAIAVTSGPGLIGSLLVGVETARTLALALDKPIVPVNHLLAHLFANFIQPDLILNSIQDLEKEIPDRSRARNDKIRFPFIGLIVSGGHTDLLLFTSLTEYKWLGGTLDDAAGEALDKIGRLLNLSYPAGPEIEERAKRIKNTKVKFVSPMINSQNFDFSFSGLKSEASRFIQSHRHSEPRLDRGNLVSESQNEIPDRSRARNDNGLDENLVDEICYATQKAIVDVLVKKTIRAAELYNCNNILIGGGVSANQALLDNFKSQISNIKYQIDVAAPEKKYSTDNGAMIGAYAALNHHPVDLEKIKADPELYFS